MKVVNDAQDDWDEHIQAILFAYRVNVQSSLKISPFEMMYGIRARLPIDLADAPDCDASLEEIEEERIARIETFATSLSETRELGRKNIEAAQTKQKQCYDLKHKAPSYKVRDKVLKFNRRRETRMGDKLMRRYSGPYEIVEVLGRGVYRLKEIDGDKIFKQTVNATNLKLWVEQVSPSQSPLLTKTQPKTSPSSGVDSGINKTDAISSVWIKDLGLKQEDKDILNSTGWLNDRIIDAANNLVARHLSGSDAQTTLLAQGNGFAAVPHETVQVVYANNHWVATGCAGGDVFVANSLGDNIDPIVQTQLKQLYAGRLSAYGELPVSVIKCSQQPNGSDCGVFAVAFVFEWACRSINTDIDVRFIVSEMRSHLRNCLESESIDPFPRIRSSNRMREKTVTQRMLT